MRAAKKATVGKSATHRICLAECYVISEVWSHVLKTYGTSLYFIHATYVGGMYQRALSNTESELCTKYGVHGLLKAVEVLGHFVEIQPEPLRPRRPCRNRDDSSHSQWQRARG